MRVRMFLPSFLLLVATLGLALPLPVFAADSGATAPFSPAVIPSLTPAQAMVLRDAVRTGELSSEARRILQDRPDLVVYLPPALREELEAAQGEEATDNAALRPRVERKKRAEAAMPEGEKEVRRRPYDWKKSVYVSRLFRSRLSDEEADRLVHFGHDLFNPRAEPAVSAESVPVPDDYVIGPGDEIVVRLWGRMEGTRRMPVDRDGKIFFPKLGPIYVAGKTFGEVKSLLHKRIRAFAEVRADISLGRVQGFPVSVLGEVEQPGRYRVSSFNTLVQALTQAGGIRDIGSLRRVQIKRGRETVGEVDLYDYLLRGDLSRDVLLHAGDGIFVPVAGPLVAVIGEVRREAIYELKGETTIEKVLAMAGGIAPSAYTRRVQVERLEGNVARTVVDLDLKEAGKSLSSFALQDGDIVRILAVFPEDENVVQVEGNVRRPGKYEWRPGLTIGSLIGDSDFFLPETFLNYALITRRVGPEKREEAVPVNLRRIVVDKDRSADVALQPMDTLMVYARSAFREAPTATVGGEVRQPGEYEILAGMRVSDLVKLGGDVTRNASLKSAELSRRDRGRKVTVRTIDLGKALAGDKEEDVLIRDGDHLLVRPVPDFQEIRFITVSGEVRSPGIYAARKNERLSSILRRAGGFTKEAFPKGAVFTRLSVQKRQQEVIDRAVAQLEQEVSRTAAREGAVAFDQEEIAAQKQVFEARKSLLSKLKQVRAQGRIVVHIAAPDKLEGTESDLLVEQGDRLEIPRVSEVVNVVGRVYNPTGIVYNPAEDVVGYYLRRVGGPMEDADSDHIFIVRADGSVVSKDQVDGRWLFGGKGIVNARVEPGDSIVVPEKLVRGHVLRDVKDITQVLYQIAVTAGVLIVAF